jgi:hypothetical protein
MEKSLRRTGTTRAWAQMNLWGRFLKVAPNACGTNAGMMDLKTGEIHDEAHASARQNPNSVKSLGDYWTGVSKHPRRIVSGHCS